MPQAFELIATPRLDLCCVTVDELVAGADDPEVFRHRPFRNPHGVFTREDLPRANRIADVMAHPGNIRWYYRIIVDREHRIAVGSISFHGRPDERGMIEIGLGIAEAERGHGFATEALTGMWDWATREPAVRFLRYTVSPANAPSIAIIRKFGFPQIGEQMDDEDGLELVFESSAAEYLARPRTHTTTA